MTALPDKLTGFNRVEFEDTCRRRFFFGLAFDPYGGTAGLYDLGPPMCAMKANMLSFWRQHFVLEENMCEVDTTCLTPEEVFIASGHVTRFNDVMVRDTVSGECIRADKYIEEFCETKLKDPKITAEDIDVFKKLHNAAGGFNKDELAAVIAKYSLKSPKGNPLSEPFPFNLMFSSKIGPEGHKTGYLRPELAQGIILNFKRLMDSGNAQRMPFAGACIGNAFRNEIAPRAALIRVREFTLAEIEHFVNPSQKAHAKFDRIKDVKFHAWTRALQSANAEPEVMTIGDAVANKLVDNETLGYFIARTQLFLAACGAKYVRFRQHHLNEMAHYAQDCWDAELLTSYGWVECVGIADRSAYDLTCHSKGSGKELSAREEFAEPVMVRTLQRNINKAAAGKAFGKNNAAVVAHINNLSEEECVALGEQLQAGEVEITLPTGSVKLSSAIVQFTFKDEKVSGRNYIPSVIEPSFGIGRVLYSILEQSYWIRRDDTGKNDKRAVYSLSPLMAPQKVAILPLMVKPELEPLMMSIRDELVVLGISNRTDDSGAAIGKKYARVDELGVPFCITLDFAGDGCVTLRERDSAKQVRVPREAVCGVVQALCRTVNPRDWASVEADFPAQGSSE
jgi:glycyl-tRNA synthetase